MTAEIVVMNRLGIALAADSAVTIGKTQGKIYTSADKLFNLCHNASVGIMIYGNASYVGMPWEIIVKTYRRERNNKKFESLEEYAFDFLEFLKIRNDLCTPKAQKTELKSLIGYVHCFVFEKIRDQLIEEEKNGTKITNRVLETTAAKQIKDHLEHIRKKFSALDGLPDKFPQKIRRKYGRLILDVRREIFQKYPLSSASIQKLTTLIIELICRHFFGPFESGIVVAGFGEKEYYPRFIALEMGGMVDGQPRYQIQRKSHIDEDNGSSISAFAQQEMVHTFMQGIDPRINNIIRQSTVDLLAGITKIIISKVKNHNTTFGKQLESEINSAMGPFIKDLFESWDTKSREVHWGPITGIVSSLPKDELAAMAEALVNLTKFRRRISDEQETVGGPIDVAVITKGDGFIWIKRKHYFNSELNPRIMGRYFKEG